MSSLVSKNKHFLQLLKSRRGKRQRALIQTACQSEIDCLCETVKNAICGPLRCSLLVKKLGRHKKLLRFLAYDRRASWKRRRDAIIQGRGAGGAVTSLGWITTLLTSLFSGALSKLIN